MILWDKYSEDEIRNIIKIHYKWRGYKIIDLHESDRRGERGADLVVWKPSEAEKIAIAIKIKPKKQDIYQLEELSKREEKEKKYIFIKDPATDFYSKMKSFDNVVDFWDNEKLLYEISSSTPDLALKITTQNHPLYYFIWKIIVKLLDLHREYLYNKPTINKDEK
ncbi:MAG: hypothetical protein ACTSYF_09760, partial [Promethearchaeota archaeon]